MIKLPVIGSKSYIELNPSKIIAVGLNYKSHLKESSAFSSTDIKGPPVEPVLFNKLPSSIIAGGDSVVLPEYVLQLENSRTDFEAEIAVIIGKEGKNIPCENALEYVKGYTCALDMSQRNMQKGDQSGWFRGKSLDTFCPIGPAILPVDQLGARAVTELVLKGYKNGELLQQAKSGDMIFTIPELVSYISRFFTLHEGDIILTGTPEGVAPVVPGDTICAEIEQIGQLEVSVIREDQ